MSTKAVHWFDDVNVYRRVCMDAQGNAKSGEEMEFSSDMAMRANRFGLNAFITEKQMKWLCQLARVEMPKMRDLGQDQSPRQNSNWRRPRWK